MRVFCVQVSFKTKYATVDKGNRLRKKKRNSGCVSSNTTNVPQSYPTRKNRGGRGEEEYREKSKKRGKKTK